MMTTITEEEIRMTATDRLARNIAFQAELTLADCEDIVDAGLAEMGDFEAREDDPTAYRYSGDRWEVDCASGRPRLLERIDVPTDGPGPHLRRVQHVFAFVIDLVDRVGGPPLSDEIVAEIREDAWARSFQRAAERDAAGAGPGHGTADPADQREDE